MRDAYHPQTLEHIQTDIPSEWMCRAGTPAPAYNPATDGCFWKNGAWVVVNAATQPPQDEVRTAAMTRTYSDVDGIYALAIGNRSEEYKQAETDARAFKAAGYSGAPSEYVSGWAITKGVTNQQSADAIITRADALAAAKLAMRNQRFTSQAAMQSATTQAELDAAVAGWDTFIAGIRAAL